MRPSAANLLLFFYFDPNRRSLCIKACLSCIYKPCTLDVAQGAAVTVDQIFNHNGSMERYMHEPHSTAGQSAKPQRNLRALHARRKVLIDSVR